MIKKSWKNAIKIVFFEDIVLVEADYCLDYIHMLVEISPKIPVSILNIERKGLFDDLQTVLSAAFSFPYL